MTEERAGSQVEHWLSLGASVVAPVTALSTLLFYFGYVSSRAEYAYYGVDVDTIGLSTRDYVMRSPQPLLEPLLVLIVISVAVVALHSAVQRRFSVELGGERTGQTVRRVLGRVFTIGLVVLVVGLLLLAGYPAVGGWRYYNLVTPMVIAVGSGVVCYCWWLRSGFATPQSASSPTGSVTSPTLRRMGVVLLCLLILSTVFWSTATIAQWSGRGVARADARHLGRLPSVVLDTKERLFLRSPGVEETALPDSAGQSFHYRYRHLRLLIHGGDRMFLVPDTWSASASTLVVAMDSSVRVQFQFQNDPP